MHPKTTLTVAMIVKNEAHQLEACLESVKDWVDEIVIMDCGSDDGTREIALQFTPRYYSSPHWKGFGLQRRLAQEYVTSDYVFWLDADERVPPTLRRSIANVLSAPPGNTVYAVSRLSWAFGAFIRHGGWYPDHVVRLYPAAVTRYDKALVHEKVEIKKGQVVTLLDGDLHHYTYHTISQFLEKSIHYTSAWAEQKKKCGKKAGLGKGLRHGLARFIRMYVLKAGFMDGRQGLLLAVLAFYSTFLKYAQLWVSTATPPPAKATGRSESSPRA